eukprot:748647-Hanusia_phi.AAC.1
MEKLRAEKTRFLRAASTREKVNFSEVEKGPKGVAAADHRSNTPARLQQGSQHRTGRVPGVDRDHLVGAGEVDSRRARASLEGDDHLREGDGLVEAVEEDESRVLQVEEEDGDGPVLPVR